MPPRWFRITYGPGRFGWVDASQAGDEFADRTGAVRPVSWLLTATRGQLTSAGAEECQVLGLPFDPLFYRRSTVALDGLTVTYVGDRLTHDEATARVLDAMEAADPLTPDERTRAERDVPIAVRSDAAALALSLTVVARRDAAAARRGGGNG